MVISQVIERFNAAKGRIAKAVMVDTVQIFVWVRLILSSPYFIGLYFSRSIHIFMRFSAFSSVLNTFNVYNGDPCGHNDPRRLILFRLPL